MHRVSVSNAIRRRIRFLGSPFQGSSSKTCVVSSPRPMAWAGLDCPFRAQFMTVPPSMTLRSRCRRVFRCDKTRHAKQVPRSRYSLGTTISDLRSPVGLHRSLETGPSRDRRFSGWRILRGLCEGCEGAALRAEGRNRLASSSHSGKAGGFRILVLRRCGRFQGDPRGRFWKSCGIRWLME